MTINWTDKANRDFRARARWLAANRDQAAVNRYLEEVMAALNKLEKSPNIEYRLADKETNTRKLRVNRQLDLYYRLDATGILIVALF